MLQPGFNPPRPPPGVLASGSPARHAGLFGAAGLGARPGWAGPAEPLSALGVLRG